MFRTCLAYVTLLCCLTLPAEGAGLQLLEAPGLAGAIWYPCTAEPQSVPLGRLAVGFMNTLRGTRNCTVTGARLPLIVFSHGRGGWFGGHADTAEALADAGFVVAAINYPGDNGNDRSQSEALSIWASRPADMVRLLDFMLKDWKDRAAMIRPGSVSSATQRAAIQGWCSLAPTPISRGLSFIVPITVNFASGCAAATFRKTWPTTIASKPRWLPTPRRPWLSRRALWLRSTSPCRFGDPNWEPETGAWMRKASRASPTACRVTPKFMSCRPATLPSCHHALPSLQQICRASALIRRVLTGPPFIASSTGVSYASFGSISSANVETAELV